MAKQKIKKVIKGLEKASKTHASQAETLKSIKMKEGGSVPSNVANPALYRKAKAKARKKFDVFPSAYASGYMVQEYKRMGGKYKGKKAAEGGEIKKDLKPIPAGNKGLKKLPTKVRNQMGFMKDGGAVMLQARGCGAIMNEKRKKTKVPR